jgi:hypothetical protein
MVVVAQVMGWELIFYRVSDFVSFVWRMKFRAGSTMNGGWCSWSIPLHEGLRNRSWSLRCGSQFPILFSQRSSAFLRVNRRIYFATRLIAGLHAGSQVSCDNFLNLRFCFNRQSNPGISLFRVESLILLVDSLFAEAVEAVKSRAALSASFPELM